MAPPLRSEAPWNRGAAKLCAAELDPIGRQARNLAFHLGRKGLPSDLIACMLLGWWSGKKASLNVDNSPDTPPPRVAAATRPRPPEPRNEAKTKRGPAYLRRRARRAASAEQHAANNSNIAEALADDIDASVLDGVEDEDADKSDGVGADQALPQEDAAEVSAEEDAAEVPQGAADADEATEVAEPAARKESTTPPVVPAVPSMALADHGLAVAKPVVHAAPVASAKSHAAPPPHGARGARVPSAPPAVNAASSGPKYGTSEYWAEKRRALEAAHAQKLETKASKEAMARIWTCHSCGSIVNNAMCALCRTPRSDPLDRGSWQYWANASSALKDKALKAPGLLAASAKPAAKAVVPASPVPFLLVDEDNASDSGSDPDLDDVLNAGD